LTQENELNNPQLWERQRWRRIQQRSTTSWTWREDDQENDYMLIFTTQESET